MMDEQWAREHIGTTPAVRMTADKIAVMRDAIESHPHFSLGGDALSVILDDLEAARKCVAQLEAQRGGADPWTPSICEYDPMIHSSRDAAKWADLFIATFPGLADKRDTMLGWFANAMMAMHDSIKQERGGAVVVAPLTNADLELRLDSTLGKHKNDPENEQIVEWTFKDSRWAYALAVSRIQPISADRVLSDRMVGVDRERLAALEAISDKIEALALGPDGRAWTPLHYREFARGELRRAQQAKGE